MDKLKTVTIVKIQQINSEINENNIVESDGKNLNLNFNIDYEFLEDGKIMAFTIGITFNDKVNDSIVFSKCSVKTYFKLTFENNSGISDSRTEFDKQLIITMLSLSISHTRAIMTNNTNGSKFQNMIAPIINPGAIYNKELEKNILESIDQTYNKSPTKKDKKTELSK